MQNHGRYWTIIVINYVPIYYLHRNGVQRHQFHLLRRRLQNSQFEETHLKANFYFSDYLFK
jgi:hypothetical protein